MSLWEEVKSNLVELYSTTTEKTSEIAKITSKKYDKFGISRDVERQFSELGNLVFSGIKEGKEDILSNPEVSILVKRIEELEMELKSKDQEIDDIRQEYTSRKSAETGETAETAGTIITDPILESGNEESAILVGSEEIEDAEIIESEPVVENENENETKIDD